MIFTFKLHEDSSRWYACMKVRGSTALKHLTVAHASREINKLTLCRVVCLLSGEYILTGHFFVASIYENTYFVCSSLKITEFISLRERIGILGEVGIRQFGLFI